MPEPTYSPPADEFGAYNQPRTLNRWLDVNPIHKLTRTRKYLMLPAFSVNASWLGYSDIIAAVNITAESNFAFVTNEFPVDPNYCLCVMWKEDGITYRYKLWENVGELFYFDVPLYEGQLIKANFRFEMWSVEPISNTTFTLTSAGTGAVNGVYNATGATTYSNGINVAALFNGWTAFSGINTAYNIPTTDPNFTTRFPFGRWTVVLGIAPAPIFSVPITFVQATALTLLTTKLGNQDYMFADDSSLATTTSAVITEFGNAFPTFPFAWPANSSPTTN